MLSVCCCYLQNGTLFLQCLHSCLVIDRMAQPTTASAHPNDWTCCGERQCGGGRRLAMTTGVGISSLRKSRTSLQTKLHMSSVWRYRLILLFFVLFLHFSLEAYSKWVEILHGQLFSCMHMCKTRQTEVEVGRQYQGLDRPGVWQVPGGSGKQGTMEKTGCEIICGAPTNLTVKGYLMMMMMMACSIFCLHSAVRIALFFMS